MASRPSRSGSSSPATPCPEPRRFYVMGGPNNRGKGSETALRNLTFTDGVLAFDVERSRGAALPMSLRFVSASEGELREGPATGKGPVIVMKKPP